MQRIYASKYEQQVTLTFSEKSLDSISFSSASSVFVFEEFSGSTSMTGPVKSVEQWLSVSVWVGWAVHESSVSSTTATLSASSTASQTDDILSNETNNRTHFRMYNNKTKATYQSCYINKFQNSVVWNTHFVVNVTEDIYGYFMSLFWRHFYWKYSRLLQYFADQFSFVTHQTLDGIVSYDEN